METMNFIYQLIYSDEPEVSNTIVDYSLNNFDHTVFWECHNIKTFDSNYLKLYIENKGEDVDYLPNPLSIPICSIKFINILSKYVYNDIQIIDIDLIDSVNKSVNTNYKILNIVNELCCLDYSKSKIRYRDNRIKHILKFVFDGEKIPKEDAIFRLTDYKYAIFFSESLTNKLKGQGLKGISFIKHEII